MPNIYCLSGLGADERIFRNLHLGKANLVHLPWVPFSVGDSLPVYAGKMAAQIREEKPLILGLSFGGMLATEIAKLMPTRKIFLVSSAKTKEELGEINGLLRFLVVNELIPYGLFTKPNSILYNQFGAETQDEKNLLNEIMKDTDPQFLSRAFRAILEWNNRIVPPNIIHIHGTADNIIRPAYVDATHWLNHGSHMMVFSRAAEIGTLIDGYL